MYVTLAYPRSREFPRKRKLLSSRAESITITLLLFSSVFHLRKCMNARPLDFQFVHGELEFVVTITLVINLVC